MPLDPQLTERLTELIHPVTLGQIAHFHQLGLRERLLTLPVMVALVLTMIWRQEGSPAELVRMLRQEGFLWCSPVKVTEQALSERLRTLPAVLFRRVLEDLLPQMHQRWAQRARPLPPELAALRPHYRQVLAVDGSTLDALLRKVGLLRGLTQAPLAGRMTALLDLGTRLPRKVWYEEDPQAHDQRCWPQILAALERDTLLLYDLGYTNFSIFRQLTQAGVTWLTRAKSNLVFSVTRVLTETGAIRDRVVWIGTGPDRQEVRLVEVLVGTSWRRYLTSEIDPTRLPPARVVAIYAQRWRIEEAYALVKRLLGLAYFWTGAQNGVELQLWATWLMYAVLTDLTDAVAERLQCPFGAVSVEMVYRSVYYFTVAYQQGQATDPVAYLAANAAWLGVLKRRRRKSPRNTLLTTPVGA